VTERIRDYSQHIIAIFKVNVPLINALLLFKQTLQHQFIREGFAVGFKQQYVIKFFHL